MMLYQKLLILSYNLANRNKNRNKIKCQVSGDRD